jgi:hypothetical protein
LRAFGDDSALLAGLERQRLGDPQAEEIARIIVGDKNSDAIAAAIGIGLDDCAGKPLTGV